MTRFAQNGNVQTKLSRMVLRCIGDLGGGGNGGVFMCTCHRSWCSPHATPRQATGGQRRRCAGAHRQPAARHTHTGACVDSGRPRRCCCRRGMDRIRIGQMPSGLGISPRRRRAGARPPHQHIPPELPFTAQRSSLPAVASSCSR
jgi:hypothetical protein